MYKYILYKLFIENSDQIYNIISIIETHSNGITEIKLLQQFYLNKELNLIVRYT